MAQHDFDIANQTAPLVRADLNSAFEALATLSSGASAPANTYPNMLWLDTASSTLKMRTVADDAWISVAYVDQASNVFKPYIGAAQVAAFLDEDDLASNSATAVPSQQSVKAYVDSQSSAAWEYLSDKTVTLGASAAEVEITGLGEYRDIAVYTDSGTIFDSWRGVKVGSAAGYPTGIYIPEAGAPADTIYLHKTDTNRACWVEILNFNTTDPLKRVGVPRTDASKIVMIDSAVAFDRVKFVPTSGSFVAGGQFHVWGRS